MLRVPFTRMALPSLDRTFQFHTHLLPLGRIAHSPATKQTRLQSNKANNDKGNDNPEMPKVSFSEMFHGAPRYVKVIAITGLAIAGTAETYFWCIWGWNKFFKAAPASEESPRSS